MSKDRYLHHKSSFIHIVHKTSYEYDEHSNIIWKKIAQHAL